MGKLFVLLAGVAGVVAFFLPLMKIPFAEKAWGVSTYQFMRGIEGVREAVGEAAERPGEDKARLEEAEESFRKAKFVFLAFFLPSVLLLLVSLRAAVRGLGRGSGALALLFGLIGLAGWALISAAIKEAAKNHAGLEEGTAVLLLLVSAGLGILGGLAGLVRPDRRSQPPAA